MFQVTPVRKPRQTRSDKWKQRPTVMRYREFADQLRAEARALGFTMPESGARVTFWLPMPDSWGAKVKAINEGQPHRRAPDVDNLLKAFLDALYSDDSGIWNVTAEKRWATKGCITVTLS